ncbi:NAD-dependent epimerase/dehydratase family protein [Modestobacter marinus]|uniref:NAD-dependent epimerase/dehydratase family protein n=1 Tax=Modestobacter marinus TaxID=477641 RepID=UPI001C98D8F7|nr:NAD-dependent epimerase/dehydratase family protein [Modestobacter marinus]
MAQLSSGHLSGLKVAVTGASGNVGTALLRALAKGGAAEVRGLARRQPPETEPYDGARWYLTDLSEPDSEQVLAEFLDGVDAVVHLAWALLPDRQPDLLHRVNVQGTERVLAAAGAAGVQHVVHMSSLGAYAAGPQERPIQEDWPITGIPSSTYSRQKSTCELAVQEFAATYPDTIVSVTRPTLVLQPEAASEIGRYFLGPYLFPLARLLPGEVARLLPLPLPGSLRISFVHAEDVADAIARILDRRAAGPFNLSASPVLDADGLARALGARRIPVPAVVLRTGMQAAFLAHVLQIEAGWLDMGLGIPPLDASRARTALDWRPAHKGDDLLREFVAALGRGQGGQGPLLFPGTGPEHTPA